MHPLIVALLVALLTLILAASVAALLALRRIWADLDAHDRSERRRRAGRLTWPPSEE